MAHSSASSIILLCPGLSLPALLPWISPPCTWREQGTQTIPQLVFPLIIALVIESVVPVTSEKSSVLRSMLATLEQADGSISAISTVFTLPLSGKILYKKTHISTEFSP